MRRSTIRTVSIIIFLVVTLFYLSPLVLPKEVKAEGEAPSVKKPFAFWTEKMLKLGLDLRGGMEISLYVDLSGLPREEHEQAVKTAVEVIRNRIDQFGVAEPLIQRVGDNKIVIQLPGLTDFERAKELIGKTALLEFKLVATQEETNRVISQLDLWLSQNYEKYPYLSVLDYSKSDDLFSEEEETDEKEWTKDIMSYLTGSGSMGMGVSYDNKLLLARLLKDSLFVKNVPSGFNILMGRDSSPQSRADVPVYVLYHNAGITEFTGRYLADADTRVGGQNDFSRRGGGNSPYVGLRFDREGSRLFERITGQYIGRQLAIVLDDVVFMAPNIRDRIRGGEAQITGNFTLQECNDLVIVLKAGNLLAPVSIGEERIVGPSLGSDSIRSGAKAGVLGLLLIMLFMIFYYRLSGMIACLAFILNSGFIFAALTFFEATLTLPGIAGIILTLGFAVDANILIFERVKEEIRAGKTLRNAVDTGYARAFVTIVDANLTSIIVAVVLYQFGSGSIKGFAVTLFIGIVASFFTAIVVTKAIFDKILANKTDEKLSI